MKIIFAAIFTFVAPFVASINADAEIDPGFDRSWGLCTKHTASAEQTHGIPRHLLGAIALAESGRWDDLSQENVAWPWTVMAEGRGRYLKSKAEAIAEVRSLQHRGITNIDVGCMQINLYHHGEAFPDLHSAFDPAANTDYAALFLVQLHDSDGSWTRAASHYHSRTPARASAYGQKVAKIWKALNVGQVAAPTATLAATETSLDDDAAYAAAERFAAQKSRLLPVDYTRTTLLNARLKSARAASHLNEKATSQRREIVAWGNSQTQDLGATHAKVMIDARLNLAPAQKTLDQKVEDVEDAFAVRRRTQLAAWRREPGIWRRASAPVTDRLAR